MLVLHHWWAGLGTFVLCRHYGLSWWAALVGGIGFLAAPNYIAHTGAGQYNNICLVAWIPWTVLAYERFREGAPRAKCVIPCLLALSFFCGHVQEVFYLCLILTSFVLTDVVGRFRSGERRDAARPLWNWIFVGGATAGLVAVELIPIWVYTRHAVRGGAMTAEQASAYSMGAGNLWQLLDPGLFGGPATYTGPGRVYWETLCHFGAVPLLLAALGVTLEWRRHPVQRLGWLWLIGLGFALGANGPVYPLFHNLVPGVALFRVPSRALFFAAFAVAVLAAFGVDSVVRAAVESAPKTSRLKRWLWTLATVAALLLGGTSWRQRTSPPLSADANTNANSTAKRSAVSTLLARPLPWAWLLAGLVPLCMAVRRPEFARPACAVLACGCLAELSLHAHQVLRTLPADSIRRHSPVSAAVAGAAVSPDGPARVLTRRYFLSDAEAWDHGIHKMQGYEPVPLQSYVTAMSALAAGQELPPLTFGLSSFDLTKLHRPLLDALAVQYAVSDQPQPSTAEWRLVERNRVTVPFALRGVTPGAADYFLYENSSVLPRAYVVGQARTPDPGEDLVQALRSLEPRQSVLLGRDVLTSTERTEFRPARIVEYKPNDVTIEVQLDQPGYLVLSDSWFPGWTATDNGRPVSVLPANIAFRAVPLDAGDHRVQFHFHPPGFTIGALISLLTVGILLATARLKGSQRI
jgi:hypothetical protein